MKKTSIAVTLAVMLTGCLGYVPGQQSYWDAQVREMCARDGGVQIFEKLRVSKLDIDLLGKIGVPIKALAHPKAPVYAELNITEIRDWNPRVSRSESIIIRRSDQTIMAKSVLYARSGGDLPTGVSEGTTFTCPDLKMIRSDLQQLFILEGDSK